jgi:hypothetical protein
MKKLRLFKRQCTVAYVSAGNTRVCEWLLSLTVLEVCVTQTFNVESGFCLFRAFIRKLHLLCFVNGFR